MPGATVAASPAAGFTRAGLTTFCRLGELGPEVTGQRLEPGRAVLACRVLEPGQWCRRCGCEGLVRDTVIRQLAREPPGWRPATLAVTIRRYRCAGCSHVWRQDTALAAGPRAKLPRRGLRRALEAIVVRHLTAARIAEGLSVAWNTASDAVPAEGKRALIDDTTRFGGVTAIGAGEHVRRHARRGGKYVTVITDLTTEELPDAVTVMDPFHVVRLAGDALDRCRRRIQQIIHGHRGRKDDPLCRARRTLHTGAGLLTDKQKDRLLALLAADEHVQVEATRAICQQMIAAYREPGRTRGRALMVKLIESLSHGVPAALSELITLGRTLKQRGDDVLAYFDRPGTSNGPAEAINGRLEHLRGPAPGFRNLTSYIARSLLESGGFRPRLHPRL
jgi:hypothetical protein